MISALISLIMWLKQCHVYHPPVITIFIYRWYKLYKLTIPRKMGGKNDIVLTTSKILQESMVKPMAHSNHSMA